MNSAQRTVRFLVFAIILSAVLLISPGTVFAQDPQPTPSDNEVNRVAKQLYCPVCENIPLDVCPTQACAEWRELIRLKLGEGWNDEQIKEYFALQYGDRVLSEPPRRGLNWLVYILPPIFFLGGAGVLYLVVRNMRRSSAAGDATAVQTSPADPYIDRVEEELKKKV